MHETRDGVAPRRFQQRERAVQVRADDRLRREDAAVHVRLRGEMDDGVGAERLEHVLDHRFIADVALHESIPRIFSDGSQIVRIAGVCQLVQIKDVGIRRWQRQPDKRGTDEACPAGNQNAHELSIIPYPRQAESLENFGR